MSNEEEKPSRSLSWPLALLVSLIYWIWSYPGILLSSIPPLIARPILQLFDPGLKFNLRYSRIWSLLSFLPMRLLGLWKLRYVGEDRAPVDQPVVYVANHASQLDIPLLMGSRLAFNWVSKRSVFLVPGFGWGLLSRGDIGLKRDDAGSIRAMLRACKAKIELGNSIMLFPEGTRSDDGKIKDFKSGAFAVAKSAGVPVVPIALVGTGKASPKGAFLVDGPVQIELRVLDMIDAEKVDAMPVKELAQLAHTMIASELEKA